MVPPLRHSTSTPSSLAFSRDSQHKRVWRQEVGHSSNRAGHVWEEHPPAPCIKGTVHQKWIFHPFHTHLDDDERSGSLSNPRNSSGVSQRKIIPPNGKRKYIRPSKDVTVQLVLNRRHLPHVFSPNIHRGLLDRSSARHLLQTRQVPVVY